MNCFFQSKAKSVATLAIGLALLVGNATAAQFKAACTNTECDLLMEGLIKAGDAAMLKKLFTTLTPEGKAAMANRRVSLNSPGGDVAEAVKLAEVVKQWGAQTFVYPDNTCASACFLVWLGGLERINTGNLGLHRPYFSDEFYKRGSGKDIAERQDKAMNLMRTYLQAQQVPQALIDTMMRRPSNDIYWLNIGDLQALGQKAAWYEEIYLRECGKQPAGAANPQRSKEETLQVIKANDIQDEACSTKLRTKLSQL